MSTVSPRRVWYWVNPFVDGREVHLVSVGAVDSTGARFYAVNAHTPVTLMAGDRHSLYAEVLKHLPLTTDPSTGRGRIIDQGSPHVLTPVEVAARWSAWSDGAELWASNPALQETALGLVLRAADHSWLRTGPYGVTTRDVAAYWSGWPTAPVPERPAGFWHALTAAQHTQAVWKAVTAHRELAEGTP